MSDPIVIVGAGQAGAKAAETLRKAGHAGRIVMLGDEPHPPYQRPPLSKKLLSGGMAEAQLWLQSPNFYDANRIELMTGDAVAAIDRAARHVTTQSGLVVPYASLLLATGSRPRVLPLPGGGLEGVHQLRGIGDVRRLREAVATARRVVIIGGGYIGLEVAAVLRAMGCEVTILEAQERLLQRVTCPTISAFFQGLHEANGVVIRTGTRVRGLVGSRTVSGVETDAGSVAADLVLVAAGGVANDELARAAGLAVADGVVIDALCRAADDVYAAGDCARFRLARYGTTVRLESVQNAIEQSRAAAMAMLGQGQPYDPVPWFWSDQYDVKLQIAGLSDGYDRSEVTGDVAGRAFHVSYFAGPRLLAVTSVNAARSHMEARRTLAAQPAAF